MNQNPSNYDIEQMVPERFIEETKDGQTLWSEQKETGIGLYTSVITKLQSQNKDWADQNGVVIRAIMTLYKKLTPAQRKIIDQKNLEDEFGSLSCLDAKTRKGVKGDLTYIFYYHVFIYTPGVSKDIICEALDAATRRVENEMRSIMTLIEKTT